MGGVIVINGVSDQWMMVLIKLNMDQLDFFSMHFLTHHKSINGFFSIHPI